MEDVLEVYQRPHDPACPVVCLDEATKQLIKETRVRSRQSQDTQRGTTIKSVMEPPICS